MNMEQNTPKGNLPVAEMLSSNVPTMSSREIAAMVEKRHDNVKRTVEMLVERGTIREAQDARRFEINAAEAARLTAEAALAISFGETMDDTYRDPDRDLPALGLRDARRLNAVR